MQMKEDKNREPPATSVLTGIRRPRFAGVNHGAGEIGRGLVVTEGRAHLGQEDLGAIIRPTEGGGQQTQHKSFHAVV